ncbi:recombinase RecT [Pseudomonas protegens]|uniref:recombinase RecT n=1 Tax=Pseudomonas protegens TaxID=380021 RepID=UPI001F3CCDA3|nr:recombinase RecT [Pseudomonas protegens]
MTQPTTLAQMQTSAVAKPNDAPMSLLTGAGFDQIQRVAKALAGSTLVPVQYRAFTEVKEYGKVVGHQPNGAGLPNCIVALNMAQRMGADPLMVMQNLYVIEGRPSWSSQFIIASINSCGRFSPLRFDISEPGKSEEIGYAATFWKDGKKVTEQRKAKIKHQTCRAWVIEKETGDRLDGPLVSIQMAIDEGWLTKNGSKWLTMPEIMLRYRAASLLGRLYAPELLMGLQSREEVEDFIEATPDGAGNYAVDVNDLRNREPEPPSVIDEESETIGPKTGEIVPDTRETETKAAETATDQAEPAAADADLPDDLTFE